MNIGDLVALTSAMTGDTKVYTDFLRVNYVKEGNKDCVVIPLPAHTLKKMFEDVQTKWFSHIITSKPPVTWTVDKELLRVYPPKVYLLCKESKMIVGETEISCGYIQQLSDGSWDWETGPIKVYNRPIYFDGDINEQQIPYQSLGDIAHTTLWPKALETLVSNERTNA